MNCDCCGAVTDNVNKLDWIVCNNCKDKMYLCDACGKSLGETGILKKDEYNNLVCVDCYEKLND